MVNRHPALPSASAAILLCATLVFFANVYRHHRSQWDDAYITFRFAQHLVEGRGLIWNVGGERVEGYSSLLQVLLLAVGMKAGIRPEVASVAISVVSVLATVGTLVIIVRRQLGSLHPIAAAVLGLYMADQTTAIHTTSGMETQLFVVLLCAAYAQALAFVDAPRRSRAICMALTVFLALLCRLEGVLYGAAAYGALAVLCAHRQFDSRARRGMLQALALSAALLTLLALLYAGWKYHYFGYLLPNPYYVKSNRLSLAGVPDVLPFLVHVAVWYGPLMLGVGWLAFRQRLLRAPRAAMVRVKIVLTLAPPVLGLLYYVTIVHEAGGAYRFSYPTYFYLVLAAAVFAAAASRSIRLRPAQWLAGIAAPAVYAVALILYQGSWRLSPVPPPGFNQYFFKIARALQGTGIGAHGTVLCNAAGIIPYVSGFNHVDRVGLTDNFLSGRHAATPEERERYMWGLDPDVYVGFEPAALAGAQRVEDDPRMATPYVSRVLLSHTLTRGWERIALHDPGLLHARMRDLRDNWYWVGEVEWPGWALWRLKSFLYVRKDSPHATVLLAALRRVIAIEPDRVDLETLASAPATQYVAPW